MNFFHQFVIFIYKRNKKMTKIRTSTQLKQLFNETRARREKKLQEERQKRLQQRQETYKQLCKRADELIKQAQEEEKRKKMEYLSTLMPKRSQKPLKQEIRYITVYNSNLIEREPNDRDLYLTREELMEAEDRGEGLINWSAWQRLIEETKQLLQ